MKVLVVAGAYPSDERPAPGSFVREQARAIAERHDVAVACLDGPDRDLPATAVVREERRDDLRTLRVSYRPPGPLRGRHDRTGMRAAVDRLEADGWQPDVIHAHYWYVAVRVARLARRRAVPLVISEHSSAFGRGLVTGRRRREAREAFGAAAIVCPVSESLQAAIRASGFDPPMRVIGNAVDGRTFTFRDRSARDGPPTIVTVAGLTPLKGIDLLVRAVAHTDARLVVIGDGAERAALEALAAGCGVSGRVDFRGELPKPAVARALAEADLFCLPSYGESQPVSVLEAMTCGVPMLVTRVGGLPEIVGEGDGVLVAPGDLDALEGGLARMLADLDGWDRRAIATRAASRFGYGPMAEQWSEVYAGVARDAG